MSPGPWLVPPIPRARAHFSLGMIAMQTSVPCRIDGSAYQEPAQDTLAIGWLEDMGVVAIDENGSWNLTALGQAAMARFNSGYRGAEPARW